MSVYVDPPVWPFRNMLMCHMLADSLPELHAMADAIGIQRRWFQNKPGGAPHYDICKSKRESAVLNGAISINRYGSSALLEAWRSARRIDPATQRIDPFQLPKTLEEWAKLRGKA